MCPLIIMLYVLLKAVLPVCMNYIVQGESQVANIVQGEAGCYICHKTITKSCTFHTKEAQRFKFLLYFTLKEMLALKKY